MSRKILRVLDLEAYPKYDKLEEGREPEGVGGGGDLLTNSSQLIRLNLANKYIDIRVVYYKTHQADVSVSSPI